MVESPELVQIIHKAICQKDLTPNDCRNDCYVAVRAIATNQKLLSELFIRMLSDSNLMDELLQDAGIRGAHYGWEVGFAGGLAHTMATYTAEINGDPHPELPANPFPAPAG